jgi:acetyltransferase-like isoleucine patch superfamily enzyme
VSIERNYSSFDRKVLEKIIEYAQLSLRLDKIPQTTDEYVLQKSADQTRAFLQELIVIPNLTREEIISDAKRRLATCKNKAQFIGIGTLIEGDVEIGEGTWIGHYCVLEGLNAKLTISEHSVLANFVDVYTHDTSYRTALQKSKFVAPVKIGSCTQIGAGTIVLPGVTIGNHVIVGARSLVNKDVKDYCVVAGVPIKLIKTLHKAKKCPKCGKEIPEVDMTGKFSSCEGIFDLCPFCGCDYGW